MTFSAGLEVIDHLLPSEVKKLAFVSVWFSFAFALFLLNRSSLLDPCIKCEVNEIGERDN